MIGYGLPQTGKPLQDIIDHFYTKIIGPYWDTERHYIDEAYQTIPFPFEEIRMADYQIVYQWSFEQLVGYIGTWSAVKHYTKQHNENPVSFIEYKLKNAWGDTATHSFTFQILLRVGH